MLVMPCVKDREVLPLPQREAGSSGLRALVRGSLVLLVPIEELKLLLGSIMVRYIIAL